MTTPGAARSVLPGVRLGRQRRAEARDADFRDWARARQGALRRSAYLLCHDWHLAEDLAQTTLAKLYAAWHRTREEGRDAYARRVLYRAFVDETRKGHRRELPAAEPPDRAGADEGDPALRLDLLQALAALPPRCRAVIVLRFWEDQGVEATAAALGITTGTVKSQTSRGLALLRTVLADAVSAGDLSRRAGRHPVRQADPAAGKEHCDAAS